MDFFALLFKVFSIVLIAYVLVRSSYYYLGQTFSGSTQLAFPFGQLSPTAQLAKKEKLSLYGRIIVFSLGVRLLTYIAAYIFKVVVDEKKLGFFSSFKDIWFKWDSSHYLKLAEHWYQSSGDDSVFIVFYPLYPLLIKVANVLFQNYFVSAVMVSLACFALANVYLYKLVMHETHDEKVAWRSVQFLSIFPFAFFYGIAYTESLFLLLTIACFYYIRTQQWLIAGIVGLFAALTRNQGVLLAVPFAIEVVQHYPFYAHNKKRLTFSWQQLRAYAPVLLIPTGILLYLVLNKVITGDYFTFLEVQKRHWNQSFMFYAENVSQIFRRTFDSEIKWGFSIWGAALFNFFLLASLLTWGWRKLPVSYAFYSVACLIISFSPSWLLSGSRYISVIFPLYILLALFCAKKEHLTQLVSYAFITLLALLSFSFSRGHIF